MSSFPTPAFSASLFPGPAWPSASFIKFRFGRTRQALLQLGRDVHRQNRSLRASSWSYKTDVPYCGYPIIGPRVHLTRQRAVPGHKAWVLGQAPLAACFGADLTFPVDKVACHSLVAHAVVAAVPMEKVDDQAHWHFLAQPVAFEENSAAAPASAASPAAGYGAVPFVRQEAPRAVTLNCPAEGGASPSCWRADCHASSH